MVANLPLCCLLTLARSVGFWLTLAATGEPAELYIWCTVNDDGTPADVVYIGKSESARKVSDEGRWAELNPHDEVNVYPAFANMVRRNRAKAFPIAVDSTLGRGDGFDPASLLEALDGLTGDYYDQLRERARIGNEWAIPDIELFLIRTAVRCGVPIANVIGTTVWYSKVWESDLRDVLAVVATDAVKAAEWPVRKTCQGCSATQMSAGLE